MTCSNLWCSWVRRAVGLASRAFATWPGEIEEKNMTEMTLNSRQAFMHPSICLKRKREWISHLPGHRQFKKTKGEPQKKHVKYFSLFPRLHACLHATKALALHIFTKPTSALFFMPESCHRVSGIYGLLAAVCYQAEQTMQGWENRQSEAIHIALWIRV